MRVPELKAHMRDRGLRNYSWLRRAELVALLQNNPPPAPQMSTWDLEMIGLDQTDPLCRDQGSLCIALGL